MKNKEWHIGDCFYTGDAAAEIRATNNRLRAREGKAPLPYTCPFDGELITSGEYESGHSISIAHQKAVQRREEWLIKRKLIVSLNP